MTSYQKGIEAFRAGQLDKAERHFRRAVREISGKASAAVWCYLGIVLAQQPLRREDALAAFAAAIAADPAHAESHYNMGLVFHLHGDSTAAISCYEVALAHRNDYPDATHNLGLLLQQQGDSVRAAQLYRDLLRRYPQDAWSYSILATILQSQGCLEEALALCRRALEIEPQYSGACCNLAQILKELGRFDEARQQYERALALEPANPKYRFNLGVVLLETGHWLEGWPWYESRENRHYNRPPCHGAEWQGEPVAGKSILLYSEQGFGDIFMMFRYAETLVDAGAEVTVLVPKVLHSLLRRGHDRFRVLHYYAEAPVADFDSSIMSLFLYLRLTPVTILPVAPYVFARASERPASLVPGRFHVGLVWGGTPQHPNDRNRSLPHFRELAPLLDVNGVSYHSLQKGQRAEECLGFPVSRPLLEDGEWDDTAAFIQHLDLVITIDSAVAHLAGAMGLPVWLLLPKHPEWRWYPYGETTPWYSTMRLCIQSERGDWTSVIHALRDSLIGQVKELHCR
jgi:tetratricopeptide (TPR) repeat protein